MQRQAASKPGSPHVAWQQPILGVVDTAVGTAVAVAAAWIGLRVMRVTSL